MTIFQPVWIDGIRLVAGERVAVVLQQPGVRAHPQEAQAILDDHRYDVGGKPILGRKALEREVSLLSAQAGGSETERQEGKAEGDPQVLTFAADNAITRADRPEYGTGNKTTYYGAKRQAVTL